ncbi:MAG: glycosyltransferase family 4 protein [Acidobacteriota bacterium]
MPDVVHIDTSRSWRGGQLQVFLLHRELLRAGVASRLLARSGGALHRRCETAGLPVEPIPLLNSWVPSSVAAVVLKTRTADIVHAHDSHATSLAAFVRLARANPKVVCHRRVAYPLHGVPGQRWKYRCVDRWIAVSSEIDEMLRRAGVEDCHLVPSAVDLDDLRNREPAEAKAFVRAKFEIEPDAPVVGLVGALVHQKGQQTLIDATPKILDSLPNAIVLLVGEGRARRRLERKVRRAGLELSVRLTGFRSDVPTLMQACTVLVAPSVDGEGSSAVIKEAMALGTPVVASDLPGNSEVLGNAGLSVGATDVEALAQAVVSLIRDPCARRELGELGRERVARWTPGAMTAGVLSAYEGVTHKAGTAPEPA